MPQTKIWKLWLITDFKTVDNYTENFIFDQIHEVESSKGQK